MTAGEIDLPGDVVLEWAAMPNGKLRLAAQNGGETVHASEYNLKILGSDTLKGQFINRVAEGVEIEDTNALEREIRAWFAEMNETYEEDRTALMPENVADVLDGTESVEIIGGDPTTVHVTLTWDGQTEELEFTADEMTGGGEALVSRMANQFYEFGFECGTEDWETLVEAWQDRAKVVAVVDESAEETVAGRILEYLAHDIVTVLEKGKLENSKASAWVDLDNSAATDVADPDAPIVWVEKTFIIDELERQGKQAEYLGQLIKTLNQRGDLYGVPSEPRRYWPNSQGKERAAFYPFRPAAVGVDVEDVTDDTTDEPAHSEVEP